MIYKRIEMKNIISIIIVLVGIVLYYLIFKYFFIKIDISKYLHDIFEPEREYYITLRYLGYLYFLYSLILSCIIFLISRFINKAYVNSIKVLIVIYMVIGIVALFM